MAVGFYIIGKEKLVRMIEVQMIKDVKLIQFIKTFFRYCTEILLPA